MRAVATLLAFAASALALQVTSPTNTTGWSTSGQNTVSWTAVSTDPQNFTVVLVNQSKFPPYQQVLDALVVTSAGTAKVSPPSAGWPSGSGFQVNLVASADQLNTILAQSPQFSFVTPSGSSSGSGSSTSPAATMTIPPANSQTPSSSSGSNSDSGALNPTTSDTSTTPSTSNAAVANGAQATFFGLVALVGALLA